MKLLFTRIIINFVDLLEECYVASQWLDSLLGAFFGVAGSVTVLSSLCSDGVLGSSPDWILALCSSVARILSPSEFKTVMSGHGYVSAGFFRLASC